MHTYRFQGHSPADPEHERGRKDEKKWARAEADPIKLFEADEAASGLDLDGALKSVKAVVKQSLDFARESPPPPAELAKELEFPDAPSTDYNARPPPAGADAITRATTDPEALATCEAHVAELQSLAKRGEISIADAVNLAVLEEMLRDPTTVCHAEDLQAGSSYNIPKLTQQTFGKLRGADEIIDEGHFLGKAIGEGMNGYRPIVEMMNTNFAIYAMAEISSAGNTFATTGGQFQMPLTIVGAGGTAPNQALGADTPPTSPSPHISPHLPVSRQPGAGRGALAALPRVHHGHPGPQDWRRRLARRRLRDDQVDDPRQRPLLPLPARQDDEGDQGPRRRRRVHADQQVQAGAQGVGRRGGGRARGDSPHLPARPQGVPVGPARDPGTGLARHPPPLAAGPEPSRPCCRPRGSTST